MEFNAFTLIQCVIAFILGALVMLIYVSLRRTYTAFEEQEDPETKRLREEAEDLKDSFN